jgi:putative phage-type endonuclease
MAEQGSDEWKRMRLGKVTASRIADMLSKTKTGWGASRANYRSQLVSERLTGAFTDSYVSAAMEWGTETEAEARYAYSFMTATDVVSVDFAPHPSIAMAGCSPDGLIGDDGLVEIKCPNTATHIETLLGRSVPGKYRQQMLFQMACTGRRWCDFVSYDPRMPEDMRLFVSRLHRDDAAISEMESEVVKFLAEVESTVAQLIALYRQQQAAE